MDKLTSLESYLLEQKDIFAMANAVVPSFSYPDLDNKACFVPSFAFIKALLETNDSRIFKLLNDSIQSMRVFECAIEIGHRQYIEKYYNGVTGWIPSSSIIRLLELGYKDIAMVFLRVFARVCFGYDEQLINYLRKHNLSDEVRELFY